jgi:hypothetical protein
MIKVNRPTQPRYARRYRDSLRRAADLGYARRFLSFFLA